MLNLIFITYGVLYMYLKIIQSERHVQKYSVLIGQF